MRKGGGCVLRHFWQLAERDPFTSVIGIKNRQCLLGFGESSGTACAATKCELTAHARQARGEVR